MIYAMIDAFGSDRLMWASDLPYQLNRGNNYEDAIGLMKQLRGMSARYKAPMLSGTAEKVFF